MTLQPLTPDQFRLRIFDRFDNRWWILTAGDFAQGRFNGMTVSWGSLGVLWDRPFVQVFVRLSRHTFRFMEDFPTFTLCGFGETYRSALETMGSLSGRDHDKAAVAGLTPVAAERVSAPAYAEAEVIIECRTIYADDLKPERFLDPSIEQNYPRKDYHRFYYGEVLHIRGTDAYRSS